jgi:hypothetical protein
MRKLIIFIIFIPHSLSIMAKDILREKYPCGLLTESYGILTESDIMYDMIGYEPTAYSLAGDLESYSRWQCFPVKSVKFTYTLWRDIHPKGDSSKIVWLCDSSFLVKDKKIIHRYFDRIVKYREACRKMFADWKKLRKGNKYVCFNGYSTRLRKLVKFWYWNKTKTKNGCISHFVGQCDTEKMEPISVSKLASKKKKCSESLPFL